MTVTEILTAARVQLDDNYENYKWPTASLLQYLNDALNTIARETGYFIDTYTSSITNITISAGTQDYAYSANILGILDARVSSESISLTKTDLKCLNESNPSWRYTTKLIGTDISFTDSGTADYISSVTSDLSVFSAGDMIVVSGSTSNDNIYTILSATSTKITLSTSDSLTTEIAGDTVTLTDPHTGTPYKYLLDYRTGYITLYPCPEEAATLILQAIRRSSSSLTGTETIGDVTAVANTPDLRSDYHYGLIDGICYRAYLKSGEHTYNEKKSKAHYSLFLKLIDTIKRDRIKLESRNSIIAPNPGTL